MIEFKQDSAFATRAELLLLLLLFGDVKLITPEGRVDIAVAARAADAAAMGTFSNRVLRILCSREVGNSDLAGVVFAEPDDVEPGDTAAWLLVNEWLEFN